MRTAPLIAAVACIAAVGCGGSGQKATTNAQRPKPPAPQYVPSAHHSHRPRGFVYNDEIGENVVTAPYDRVIELFGPPASRHGRCIVYKIVGQPKGKWTFCFKGQRMISASG